MKRLHFIPTYLKVRAMSKSSLEPQGAKQAGRPKACDVEARMNDLIDTAGALFLKNGYTKVSLEAIARQAHVAVRTIYVKFGGKAGLLNAVIQSRRDRFFRVRDMETDPRPFKEIIDDFARHFQSLLWSPDVISMQRVVIAEAATNPELAQAFQDGGPKPTLEMLERFFARPEIRAQMRDDVPLDSLPYFLVNCISGDPLARFLPPTLQSKEKMQRALDERLSLFYRGVLREA
jgi:TetR/AcrR family transcriptional repressor of mexJK operon